MHSPRTWIFCLALGAFLLCYYYTFVKLRVVKNFCYMIYRHFNNNIDSIDLSKLNEPFL